MVSDLKKRHLKLHIYFFEVFSNIFVQILHIKVFTILDICISQ